MRRTIILIMVSLILSLVPTPTSAQESQDVCATVIVAAIQQSGLEPQTSAPVFGCTQDDGGYWYMRKVSSTRDGIYLGTLGAQEESLLRLVDTMSMDQAFLGAVQFDRSTSRLFTVGPRNVMNPSDISDQAVGSAPHWLNNYTDIYSQAMQNYLTRTAGQVPDLVEYMQWFMARRDATLSSMTGGMNPMAGTAFLANWGYQQFPWFWQLADQEAITAYTGQEPVVSNEPSNGSSSGTSLSAQFSPSQISALPGDRVEITVSLPPTSFSGSFALNVTVPAGIEMIDVPMCRSSGTCADGTLELEVENNPDGSTVVNMSGLLYEEPAELALGLKVSEDIPSVTSSLFLTAELFFGSHSAPFNGPAESTLEVVIGESGTGSSASDQEITTSTTAAAALPNTPLALNPSEARAQAGDVVVIDLAYARLQGINSVAFMAASEGMWIDNLPRYLIDEIGNAACSAGHEGDIVSPVQRATELGTIDDFPPAHLDLIVSPDVQPGDRLRVCVEMIGFSGDTELFAWNAEAIIEIVK